MRLAGRWGPNTIEDQWTQFSALGGWLLADLSGRERALTELVAAELRDLVDRFTPDSSAAVTYMQGSTSLGGSRLKIPATGMRIRRADGTLAGTALLYKPAAGMTTLSSLAAQGDLRHFARMQGVARPARRPAAILFADLEGSSSLARRLSTAGYFALGDGLCECRPMRRGRRRPGRPPCRRRCRCVLPRRHRGLGVDGRARMYHRGARASRRDVRGGHPQRAGARRRGARLRTPLGLDRLVGQITTSGRSEATGLGDEVNEAARIEACASGGRTLASKSLIEGLAPDDAAALAIEPDGVSYERLADLSTATEKARRDAPAIAVCDI